MRIDSIKNFSSGISIAAILKLIFTTVAEVSITLFLINKTLSGDFKLVEYNTFSGLGSVFEFILALV